MKILKTFHIGGKGNWDALLVDPDSHRLYIARGTRVMVLDSEQGTSLGEVGELQGAHGVALAKDHNLGFATSGRENTVVVFDLGTLKTIKRIKAGQNPDAILYDPASQKVFAFCGRSGEAAIIDPANLEQDPVLLPLGSKLEFGVADGGGRVYVNDEKKNEVIAIDSKEQKVIAPLAPAPQKNPPDWRWIQNITGYLPAAETRRWRFLILIPGSCWQPSIWRRRRWC